MIRRSFLKTGAALGASAFLPMPLPALGRTPAAPQRVEDSWLRDAVDAAGRRGAEYAEILHRKEQRESIQLRKDEVHMISDSEEAGMTLRVFKGGAWGAAAISAFSSDRPDRLAERACAAADAMAVFQRETFDPGTRAAAGTHDWETPVAINPWDVPLGEKIAFLRELTAKPLQLQQIPFAVANLFSEQSETTLVTSRDALIRQKSVITYPNFAVTAFHHGLRRMDNRSSSMEAQAAGWEITKDGITSDLETAMQEVLKTQTADPVKAGTYKVVIHPTVLWDILSDTLLPHLDARRVLGVDGSRPGDRWIAIGDIGHRRLGSKLLRLHADTALSRGLASAGWDDSGRPAARALLVEDGVLRRLPYADGLPTLPAEARFPFARTAQWNSPAGAAMPDIVMEEGEDGDLQDLLSAAGAGLFIKGRGSIVTNPARTIFRLRPQAAWIIRNGNIEEMVRGVEIETTVEQFWNALIAVGRGKDTLTAGNLFPGRSNALWTTPFSVSVPPAVFADIPVYTAEEAGT